MELSKEAAFLEAVNRWLDDVLDLSERACQRAGQEPAAVQRFGYLNPRLFCRSDLLALSNKAERAGVSLSVLADELFNLAPSEDTPKGKKP
jgi:predicted HicB family RNase H-like nuclease